jgi:hypothetical protein
VAACARHTPLDLPLAPPTPINGQIVVTALNGVSATPGVSIEVISPSGAVSISSTSSLQGAFYGTAVFKEPIAGRYTVEIPNQPANSPFVQTVILTPSQPYASVVLQLGGAYLNISCADGMPLTFTSSTTTRLFTVQYVNPSALQSAITLLPAQLPAGWSASLGSATLQAGQTTYLYVQPANDTLASSVPITINGYSGNKVVATGAISLARAWNVSLFIGQYFGGDVDKSPAGECSTPNDDLGFYISGFSDAGWTATVVVTSVTEVAGNTPFCIHDPLPYSLLGQALVVHNWAQLDNGGEFSVSGTIQLYAPTGGLLPASDWTMPNFGTNNTLWPESTVVL